MFRRLAQVPLLAAAALSVACQGVFPGQPAAPGRTDSVVQAAGPSFVITPERRDGALSRLAGRQINDWVAPQIGANSRWQKLAPPAPNPEPQPATRSLMALGAAVNANWTNGIDIRSAPYNCTGDFATNGFASRNDGSALPKRVYMVTRNGTFLDMNPDNPSVGFCKTALGDTFTKTYVTLAGNGSIAFVVSDNGRVYAIDLNAQSGATPPARTFRSFYLTGSPTYKATGSALFADPLASDFGGTTTTLYVCDSNGGGHQIVFDAGSPGLLSPALFAGASFGETSGVVPLSVATPHSGTARIAAPPVVLGGKGVVGDRAGNLITYDWNAGGTPVRRVVNYGWPIESAVAVDTDDDLTPTDYFAAAGAQLVWMKDDGTIYTGQYALLEKGGNDGVVDNTTFNTYVTTVAGRVTGTTNWTSFASAKSNTSNAGVLPLTNDAPASLDNDHLAQCEILSGLPPEIYAFSGATGRPFYDYYPWNVGGNTAASITISGAIPGTGTARIANPVQDGQTFVDAQLQGPSGIDFDSDGSFFVADTNHCQVLFKPGTSTSWQNWYPAGAMTNAAYNWRAGNARPDDATAATRYYVFAGTTFPHAPCNETGTPLWSGADSSDGTANRKRDVGNGSQPPGTAGGSVFVNPPQCPANGTTGGTIARGSAINRVQSATLGELGLYLANRNAFQGGANDNGQILFIPRVGLPNGTYWGITNPQPGRMYVICNFVDPQGMAVWRDPSATRRDVLFAPSMSLSANSVSKDRVLKLDSATMTPATTMNTAGVTMATGLSNPYDCALDDDGNLFIAENGNNELSMIAKVVPPSDGVYERNWGVANPTAGTLYSIRTGLSSIASVTFAANDPQVPSGCLYIALGAAPTNGLPHRIIRMDETRTHQSVAGAAYTFPTIPGANMADSADSTVTTPVLGDAAATRLAIPWRARGDGEGTTYICDRGNNRIRKLESSSGSSQATGYLSLPYSTSTGSPLGKPVYSATLRLYSKTNAGALSAPQVGLVSPFLKNGNSWSNATIAANTNTFLPTLAPDVDLTLGRAQPSFPNTTGNWTFATSPGGNTSPYYEWKLPAQLLFSSATDTRHQHLRLGMAPPADANQYYYPVSQGVVDPPYYKAPDFYTNVGASTAAATDQRPRVDFMYGNIPINYPILSPPAIAYAGATRYIYAMNSNALWRYNTTTPADFIGANGATDVFTRTAQGRAAGKGTLYTPATTFMFNSTPPLVNFSNQVLTVDTWATNATTFTYHLSAMNGGLASGTTNMWQNQSAALATNVAGSPTDSAGIFMVAGDPYLTTAYMGLANGRIYMVQLQ